MIHSSAIIESRYPIDPSNEIGPYCYIGPGVEMGKNNVLRSHVVIGSPAEWRGKNFHGRVQIGDDNLFSEFVTVHASAEELPTVIGSRCIFYRGSHVGHDAWIDNDCSIFCNAIVGGFTRIETLSSLALGSIVHQSCVIPKGTMLGMGCVVNKSTKLEPFGIYVGNPARFLRVNEQTKAKYGKSL